MDDFGGESQVTVNSEGERPGCTVVLTDSYVSNMHLYISPEYFAGKLRAVKVICPRNEDCDDVIREKVQHDLHVWQSFETNFALLTKCYKFAIKKPSCFRNTELQSA